MHLYRVGQALDGTLMVSVDDVAVAVMELSQRYIDHGWPLIGYAVAHVADHLDGISLDGAIVVPDSVAGLDELDVSSLDVPARWWKRRGTL